MTNRKNHNSIIFLTTLSVYLGLVLVGGVTPSVFAQAAAAQKFDVKSEIEVKDDLDKNPDESDEISEDAKLVRQLKIAQAITNFLSDVRKLESIGKVDSKQNLIFSHKVWLEEFDGTITTSENSDIPNPWLKTAVEQLISEAEPEYLSSISDYTSGCREKNCRESSVKIESSANEFALSFTFTKSNSEKAKFAAEEFNRIFLSQKIALKQAVNLPFYENTKATSENNQVFIVTRLARASIDELLADKTAR